MIKFQMQIFCRNVQSLGPPLPFGEASLWEPLGVTFRLNPFKLFRLILRLQSLIEQLRPLRGIHCSPNLRRYKLWTRRMIQTLSSHSSTPEFNRTTTPPSGAPLFSKRVRRNCEGIIFLWGFFAPFNIEKVYLFVFFYETCISVMKKVKFNDVLDIQIIQNRLQMKEKERFYTYCLCMYILSMIGSIVFLFYQNYPISFIFIVLACFIYLLSNWDYYIQFMGIGINSYNPYNPYSLSLIPQEIIDFWK